MARTKPQATVISVPDEAAAEWRHIDQLDFWDGNPRDNDDAAVEVAELIILYGFGTAMMAWPDPKKKKRPRIIAGNTRKKATLIVMSRYRELKGVVDGWHPGAVRLAKTGMVPVRIRYDLTEEQATELALADNKANELAKWKRNLLSGLLRNMPSARANLLGWKDAELARLLRVQHPVVDVEPKIERAAELASEWGTKPGQLWKCGVHMILCGDTTNPNDVTKVMGGAKATVGMQDPPYGVAIGKKNRLLQTVQKSGRCLTDIEDDDLTPDELRKKLQPSFENYLQIVAGDDCTHFIFAPSNGEIGEMMTAMLRKVGMPVRHVLMWLKNQPTFSMGKLDYDYKHEPIYMTWGDRHKRIMGGNFRTSVWAVDRPRASPDHPTPKPPELYCNALLNHSDEGDIAFDGYGGSGTMIIACEQTRRVARVIEKQPGYVAVTLQRWLEATNDRPVLVS